MFTLGNYLSTDGRSLLIDPDEKAKLDGAITSSNKKLPKAKKNRDGLQNKVDNATRALEAAEAEGNTKKANRLRITLGKLTTKLETAKTAVSTYETTISDSKSALLNPSGPSITELYQKADPKTYENISQAGEYASKIGQISPEGQRFLDAAGTGYQARDLGTNAISAAQIGRVADINSRDISAAQIGAVDNIRARQLAAAQTGVSGLGQNLMQTAQERLALGGNLSAQASRDAIQAARAGMAARGLGTGNSALAAELLNRDRYSQQRFLENAAFAQGVEQTDLQRRVSNTQQTNAIGQSNQDAALRASMSNQAAAQARAQEQARLQQQASLANQQAALEASTRNQSTALSLGTTNAQLAQQASLANQEDARLTASFNEQNRLTSNQQNLQQLGAASNYVDATNRAGMAAATDMASINSTYNPLFRNLGMSQQNFFGTNNLGTAAMGPSIDLAGNVASFNSNMQGSIYNTYQNNRAGLKSANIQADATRDAGNMGLQGAAMGASAVIGAAAACWVARAAFGTATARWQEYRRAMLRHASDRTIRLYCQHGQALAATLTTPLRRLAARVTLRTLEWSWN